MIQSKLADMALRIEASRLLLYKAAALKDQGKVFLSYFVILIPGKQVGKLTVVCINMFFAAVNQAK